MGPDTPPAAIVYQAAHTTIPVGEFKCAEILYIKSQKCNIHVYTFFL